MAKKLVISASRKEDIITNLNSYNNLQMALREGIYTQSSKYSGTMSKFLNLNEIGAVVLWSKNYANFLKNPGVLDNFNLYFQFTITGYSSKIEKGVPNSEITINQMRELAEKYGSSKINWRFDPIAFFVKEDRKEEGFKERLETFEKLCIKISSFGVSRCTISFLDLYNAVSSRLDRLGIEYYTPNEDEKIEFLKKLKDIAAKYNIELFACSNPEMSAASINKSSCIDGAVLSKLFNIKFDSNKDSGQRVNCGCTKSTDIGNYTPCPNQCAYCYSSSV